MQKGTKGSSNIVQNMTIDKGFQGPDLFDFANNLELSNQDFLETKKRGRQ